MWGEHTDESNLETVAWPRGAAALEVMWSSQAWTDGPHGRADCVGCDGVDAARSGARSGGTAAGGGMVGAGDGCADCHMVDRVREHACRLKRRGLRPAPGNWGYCGRPGEELFEGGFFAR